MNTPSVTSFSDLRLDRALLQALDEVGYEMPSPIQAQTIPHLLKGKDVLGQAQTGTGKTAAFALPLLSSVDLASRSVQVLVLTPTRELAIQVAEAFQKYAKHLNGFHVLPVYGGQDYRGQIRSLERGVHVVVGTPGRVMDHMRRGTLKLKSLNALVLDEADEMLRMGFIDDVEWILEQAPARRQIALFSATMPAQIKRIASKYLSDPVEIIVKTKAATANLIRQRYLAVSRGSHKLDAITRILEAEVFDAVLVFVRTKTATTDLADKLEARGYACAALNGDIPQKQRERTVEHLKRGKLDIIVATDVAARGLDVERITHVINYDIPTDVESYIHRIGRTGRAGRVGDAILFVAPRERHLQRAIERATSTAIKPMELPSNRAINERRVVRFKQRITESLKNDDLSFFEKLVEDYCHEHEESAERVSAALAQLVQGDLPFLFLNKTPNNAKEARGDAVSPGKDRRDLKSRSDRSGRHSSNRDNDRHTTVAKDVPRPMQDLQSGMERFRLEVGRKNGIKPGNIVGAIANEAGIDSQYMGQIQINDSFSLIDLPEGMPKAIFKDLQQTRVCGIPMRLSRADGNSSGKSDQQRKKSNKAETRRAEVKPIKKRKKGKKKRKSTSAES